MTMLKWGTLGVLAAWITAVASLGAAGEPDLALAVKNRDTATAIALLEQGADVNLALPDGATAVHWAVHWNDATTGRPACARGRGRERGESIRCDAVVDGLQRRQRCDGRNASIGRRRRDDSSAGWRTGADDGRQDGQRTGGEGPARPTERM